MSDAEKIQGPSTPGGILVKYILWRAGHYRSIHVDGAWASLDQFNKIHLALFNEHPPVPQYVTQEAGKDGKWVEGSMKIEHFPAVKDAHVVRELESEIVMTVEAAKVIRDLLTSFISTAEDIRKKATEGTGGIK